jgi:hypothetical protein
MLTIRREQLAVFEAAIIDKFLAKLEQHVRTFFPEQCKSIDSPAIRRVCEHGRTRAASYGIVSEQDVCKYINLMFTFGRDFDTDPEWPWAAQILTDRTVAGPTLRMNRLYIEAMSYARDGSGLNSSGTIANA